ncbi:MAG: serine O-acetyltransferase [Alphaproteobacteria bacterium]|nr:serine O-acetyltransferase [Alphaproteobacteria bacterium]
MLRPTIQDETNLFKRLIADIDAYLERDPAARTRMMIVLAYPGLHATWAHRVSHWLWSQGWRILPRVLANIARLFTGIEIHPAAKIGPGLVIDHGMGVVIGETAEIGARVTLYHDVTLGGTAPAVDSVGQRNTKRHPTLMDDVIVGSGAQVLGPITVGCCARVGANAVVVRDVPEGATVVGVPARVVQPKGTAKPDQFTAYGTPTDDLPDPVARAVERLSRELMAQHARIEMQNARIEQLERELAKAEAVTMPKPDDKAGARRRKPAADKAN